MSNILSLRERYLQAQREADLAYRKYEVRLRETFQSLVPRINSHLNGSSYQITDFQIERGEIEILINCACESLEEDDGERIKEATRREMNSKGLWAIGSRLSSGYYGL